MNKIKNDNEKVAEGFWMVINIIVLMCVLALFGAVAAFFLGN